MDQAGVVVLWLGALLDDAALLVGDGGEAAGVLVDDVEVAQTEDHGNGHDGHHHQDDADRGAPRREAEGSLYGLKGGVEEKQAAVSRRQTGGRYRVITASLIIVAVYLFVLIRPSAKNVPVPEEMHVTHLV